MPKVGSGNKGKGYTVAKNAMGKRQQKAMKKAPNAANIMKQRNANSVGSDMLGNLAGGSLRKRKKPMI